MKVFNDIDIEKIAIELHVLPLKLKNIVSWLDILEWLGNFKNNEIPIALDIALNMNVYTTYEIEEIFENKLNEIIDKYSVIQNGATTIIVHPVGQFAKSGSMLAYFFKKTHTSSRINIKIKKNCIKLLYLPHINMIQEHLMKDSNSLIVLIDDFVGTGTTIFDDIRDKNLDTLISKDHLLFVGIAAMREGLNKISPLFNEVFIPTENIFDKIFSKPSIFFNRTKLKEIKQFAENYATQISGSKSIGWGGAEALVAFSYGSPNNTSQIIWANKKKNNTKWIPLIPRFIQDKMDKARMLRKLICHELSLFRELGPNSLKLQLFTLKSNSPKHALTFGSIDFSIYSIIRFKQSKYSDVSICQKLGIMYEEYESFIQDGISRGIFLDKAGNLSSVGVSIYYKIRKIIAEANNINAIKSNNKIKEEINYLPKKFNGRS